jgi:tetratricopeptide (TPR) repeat protein
MNENGFDTAELTDLQERWEREPTPQLALQLAEVYGRRGLAARAAEVLERAIRRRPDHLSARVALGRYRLDLGETRASVETLEQVVATDPTHLVANKLLVKGYSELGMAQKARDRLDLYRLLNESDPEIGALQQLVTAAPGGVLETDEPAEIDLDTDLDGELELEVPTESESESEISFGGGAQEPPLEAALAEDHEPRPDEGAPERVEWRPEKEPKAAPVDLSRREPFPDLWARLDAALYREELFSELFRGGGAPHRIQPRVEREAGAAPVFALETAPSPEPPASEEADERGESSSVTLADLYADQGHRLEAIHTLRGVLGREPDNEQARLRLAALAAGEEGDLTAFDLLDGRDFAAAVSLEERRARLLRSYLDRISGGSGADV